jgi:outer membrane protein assembly factor BamB
VHKGLVSVYAGAKDKTLTAYKLDTGEIAWTSERETKPELSYCSTHLATFEGVESLLILSDRGASAYEPETGKLVWTHDWETSGVVRCVQPALIEGKDFLIGTGLGIGTQRVHVERKDGKWTVNEVWKTTQFKPYYNDMVLHEGHAYGYDNNFFCCVDLKDGKVKWKARGYGTGQALLLAKQGLLLIVTEKGELALVEAKPGAHKELGKIKVIEGKTWNHPILVNGRVYLRNGEEFACVELPKGDGPLAKDGK